MNKKKIIAIVSCYRSYFEMERRLKQDDGNLYIWVYNEVCLIGNRFDGYILAPLYYEMPKINDVLKSLLLRLKDNENEMAKKLNDIIQENEPDIIDSQIKIIRGGYILLLLMGILMILTGIMLTIHNLTGK